MNNPILISSTNWKSFKKLYDRNIRKGYISATYIQHFKDVHSNSCGWSSVFLKNI